MKELEETHCEVRRIIDIQPSIWDRLNSSGGDESSLPMGSPTFRNTVAPLGGFLDDANYVWLSCGPRFVVLSIKTGGSVATWTFRERVTCVAQFPAQSGQIPLLLVGLDNGATKVRDSAGMICIFDCTTSRVLRAVRLPAGVEQICVMDGGAEWEDFNEKRTDTILSKNCGTACVTLRNLYHVAIDLRRTLWEGENFRPVMDETCPSEADFLSKFSSSSHHYDKGKHMAHNLLSSGIEEFIRFNRDEFEMTTLYDENLTSAIIYSRKIGCLFSGCQGRIIIWKEDGSVGWISPPNKEHMAITHFALLEPTDDPKPFYYLWVVYQEKSSRLPPILRMYAMLFERKYCDKGTNLYFNLEGDPSLKFELELEDDDEVISLSPVERNSNHEQSETNSRRGEESLLLISINGKALLFDLNQWYKEQMPRTVGECQHPNTFLVNFQMRSETQGMVEDTVLNCAYVSSSLREFPSNGGNSPEELFYPNSLSLEWVELGINRLTFWLSRGSQWELLREMAVAGPTILIQPSETFHRCLAAGLVPFNTECSFSSDQNAQREMLLSLCLEQRWAPFLIRCAKEWADGSVAYLFPAFLRWGAQRASSIKMAADQLCVPLFDQSGSSIGDTEIKMLRFCSQQLECLSNVVARLPIASSDLVKQQRALRRVATHLQVLLWFYDVGLLPETQEMDEERLPINFTPQIPYPYERLAGTYRVKRGQVRQKDKNGNEFQEDLFIDELMTRECRSLRSQWEREGGDITTGGYYPPASLQSLLRSYLVDCHQDTSDEMENKHQITIYLLMDLAKLLHSSCPGVEQLIKYPSAFKMSPSLIKLTQAFWLLDHEDYQGFLDMLTGQLVSDSDVKDWHHKLVIRTLMRNSEYKLALTYLRVRKPPLSAISDQGTSISLSVERGLVQAAFHQRPPSHYRQLLTCFFQACKARGKLNDILQLALNPEEEEAFVKFLEEDKCDETRLIYYLQRCRYTEASNVHPFGMSRNHLKSIQSAPLTMVSAYNATLPEVTRQFSSNMSRRQFEVDPESRYPRPMSHSRSYNKSQGIYETVVKKARETYVRGDRCQIPFISAPCTSLKLGGNANTSCVLFPVLSQKAPGKRTLDQMWEDDEIDRENSEDRKRRRISGGNDSLDKSGMRELGISVAFETPLVQRKRQITNAADTPSETPHSILKIRQLIRSSTSPGSRANHPSYLRDKELSKDRERRQIRFSVGQPLDDSNHEESMDEKVDGNASEESEDAFYSPNASGKSQSTDSTYSSRSISGPRPRPSLRNSSLLSSNGSSIVLEKIVPTEKTSVTQPKYTSSTPSTLSSVTAHTSPTSAESEVNLTKITTDYPDLLASSPPAIPRTRSSLFNASKYSSSVLSSESSFLSTPGNSSSGLKPNKSNSPRQVHDMAEGGPRISLTRSQLSRDRVNLHDESLNIRGRKLVSMEFNKSVTVSHSTVTKTSVFEEFNDDKHDDEEVIMEVDDFGLDHDPEIGLMDSKRIEQRLFGKTDTSLKPLERQDSWDKLESERKESVWCQNDAKELERKKDSNVSELQQRVYESSNEGRNQPEEIVNDLDDYEEELIILKDKEEDDNDEESFQSLTNSNNSAMENAKPFAMSATETRKSFEEIDNGMRHEETNILSNDSNITEDESSEDEEIKLIIEEPDTEVKTIQDSPKKIEADKSAVATVQSQSLSNDSNFTEDESSNSSNVNEERIVEEPSFEMKEKQELIKKGKRKESIRSSTYSRNRHSSITKEKSPVLSRYPSRDGDVTDNLEYSETAATPNLHDVTDDLEKLDETRRQEKLQSSRTSSVSNADVFIGSETDSTISKVSTKVMPSMSGSESGMILKQTPVRMTRSRRASSMAKSIIPSSGSESQSETPRSGTPQSPKLGRTRRASSLAKEALVTSVTASDPRPTVSSGSDSPAETLTPQRGRGRRSTSLAKEVVLSSLRMDETRDEVASPLRRSTRRAASVQKEIPSNPVVSTRRRKTSTSSSIIEEPANAETEPVTKRTTRTRRGSSVTKELESTLTTRSTRSSSVGKETQLETENKNKKSTRKRGDSVSKETASETKPEPRTRRASSVAKEMSAEESTESSIGPKRGKTSLLATIANKKVVNSPAKNTRTRRSSVSSIPEEMEEVLSSTTGGRSSSVTDDEKRPTRGKLRERRAVSMEPSQPETKRKIRSALARSTLAEETIEEESNEDDSEQKNKTTRIKTTRKRTQSAASNKDDDDVTENSRSGAKGSQLNEEEEDFLFSPPEANSAPTNQQEVEQVPPYIFSPPHTRSKHTASSQHRRELKEFCSPLTAEEKQVEAQRRGVKAVGNLRIPKTVPQSRSRNMFVVPKRSKSTSSD